MKPEETAIELINEFIPHSKYFADVDKFSDNAEAAKQCALICVDTILGNLKYYNSHRGTVYIYWEQVKNEIKKL